MTIERLSLNDFDSIYSLMENSFILDEIRDYDQQKELFFDPNYSVYGVKNNDAEIEVFIALWKFVDFAYIEHFVVNPKFRNKGLGAKFLNKLTNQIDLPICLEVEPPETKLAERRIDFYQRNNFYLNTYPYIQPSLSKGRKSIKLQIMTFKRKISLKTFKSIENTLHHFVYKTV